MEDGGFGLFSLPLFIALIAFYVVVGWRIFTKAGQPGWASIVPLYNVYVLLNIVGRPGWWLLLLLLPVVNFVIAVVLSVDLAKSFGKSTGFGIGVFVLGFIFCPLLAFGKAPYVGPAASDRFIVRAVSAV